ncbi:unnamed protein product [Penicillium salamii]|nr:unnamed protein product [Penicillium salamii]CAG7962029.1 unnamed protein product [Penicillium salamii]CAG8274654.1 unnamed protein product [Penicillium salamii]
MRDEVPDGWKRACSRRRYMLSSERSGLEYAMGIGGGGGGGGVDRVGKVGDEWRELMEGRRRCCLMLMLRSGDLRRMQKASAKRNIRTAQPPMMLPTRMLVLVEGEFAEVLEVLAFGTPINGGVFVGDGVEVVSGMVELVKLVKLTELVALRGVVLIMDVSRVLEPNGGAMYIMLEVVDGDSAVEDGWVSIGIDSDVIGLRVGAKVSIEDVEDVVGSALSLESQVDILVKTDKVGVDKVPLGALDVTLPGKVNTQVGRNVSVWIAVIVTTG